MKSKLMTLNSKDLLRGIFVAFLTALLTGIIKILEAGAAFNWASIKPVLIAGLCAALSYLIKCLATNSRDEMFTAEPS